MVVTYQLRDGVGLYQRSSSAPNPNPYVPRMGETVLLLPSVREPGTQERRYTVHEVITPYAR